MVANKCVTGGQLNQAVSVRAKSDFGLCRNVTKNPADAITGKQVPGGERRITQLCGLSLSAALTAASAPWNPMRLCVPSQKGLFTEPPQRHSENAGLPVR